MADFLTQAELEKKVGAGTVRRMVDDAAAGVVDVGGAAILEDALRNAEGTVYASLMRAYSPEAVVTLAQNDAVLMGHAAWIALELLSERRVEFTSAEGWGAYRVQYERATKHLELVSKGALRSKGEAQAGQNPHLGGTIQPSPPAATEDAFTFAPSRNRPSGGGGF